MITIEIDCNSDIITLIDDNGIKIAEYKIMYPDKLINMFSELLNRIDPRGVEIVKIDEDKRTQLEEWGE